MKPIINLGPEMIRALSQNTLVVITNTDGCHVALICNRNAGTTAKANGKTAVEAFEKLETVLLKDCPNS